MRIVLDTSILVRANDRSEGLARQLLLEIVARRHTLLLCGEMLHELAKVLRYPRMRALYGVTEAQVYNYISFLREAGELVTLNPLLTVPIRDLNDVAVVQAAVIGGADILCTRDDDFFEPGIIAFLKRESISVMDDVALMERVMPGRG